MDGVSNELFMSNVSPNMNNVAALTDIFKEFGEITGVSACYEEDERAAIIKFSKIEEAQDAFKKWESSLQMQYLHVDDDKPIVDCTSESPSISNVSNDQNISNREINPKLKGTRKTTGISKKKHKNSFDETCSAFENDIKKKTQMYANLVKDQIKDLESKLKSMNFYH